MQADQVHLAVIIPAYRPEPALLDLIAALSEKSIPAIVLVDDGSGPDYADIFSRAAEFPKVRLVRHAVNLGKGAALKAGFNYALCEFPNLCGVVSADADGQHDPDDIEHVAETLASQPDHLILGTRTFGGEVPWRSLAGNVITRTVMRALVGQRVSDTQTGLRGIPASLLPHLLRTESNGYDFELDMLIAVRQQAIHITEVPIRTIYSPGNRTSHFNPLIDSMKIYFVLLRFSWVGLMSALLDTLIFYLAYRRFGNLAASQAIGRVMSVAFNYSMVRRTVFFSKLRHAAVLPKYLLLVCLSGTASYAGIQLLNTQFHIRTLPAKLFVETLLFFANFAIQRDFIFGKSLSPDGNEEAQPRWIDGLPRWIPTAVLAAVAIALLLIVVHGLRGGFLQWDGGWTGIGRRRLIHYAWVFWAASMTILLVGPRYYASIVALLITAATAAALGPLALLAVAFFLISSCALGSKLFTNDDSAESQLCATLVGVAVYIFLMTFLARLPVNYPAVYLLLLAIPVIADLRGVWRRLVAWTAPLVRPVARPRRLAAAFALLVFVLGMHWLILPLPEASADGLAMHLAIPVNLSLHHVLTYRPERIFWSVMPMGADWCYSMVYLLGGEYAARLLNFAMLLLVEAMLYRAVRRWVTPAVAFLVLALFASSSLVGLATGSLFVENFQAALIVGMAMSIWRFTETAGRRFLFAAAVLGGTTLAVKLGSVAYLAAALPVAAIEIGRQWRQMGSRRALVCVVAVLLLVATALPTYAISWRLTGDPVFPFWNQRFPSPLVDRSVDFVDHRFQQPLRLATPFDLTFRTNQYYEGRPGSIGFHYLLLIPLGLLALPLVKGRLAGFAAFLAAGGAVMVLRFLPNVRYLYPSLPLAMVPLAALLGWLAPGGPRRLLIALVLACVGLNIWFLPSSGYNHGDFYEGSPFSRAMRQRYIHTTAPMREIGEYMNTEHPASPVFLTNGNELAAFQAEVYSAGWHQAGVRARLQLALTSQEILDIFHQWNIHYAVAPKPGSGEAIALPTLRDLVERCATPEYQASWLYLVRLNDQCTPMEHPPLLALPGWYDDNDPAIAYHGPWTLDMAWPSTDRHTVTYCNIPGCQVRFAFRGEFLMYVYTKAANRGRADIIIDGTHKDTLDFYSSQTQWQAATIFAHLGPGNHLAVITVLPDKSPQASDRFVDVDAFRVQ